MDKQRQLSLVALTALVSLLLCPLQTTIVTEQIDSSPFFLLCVYVCCFKHIVLEQKTEAREMKNALLNNF